MIGNKQETYLYYIEWDKPFDNLYHGFCFFWGGKLSHLYQSSLSSLDSPALASQVMELQVRFTMPDFGYIVWFFPEGNENGVSVSLWKLLLVEAEMVLEELLKCLPMFKSPFKN